MVLIVIKGQIKSALKPTSRKGDPHIATPGATQATSVKERRWLSSWARAHRARQRWVSPGEPSGIYNPGLRNSLDSLLIAGELHHTAKPK